MPYRALFESAPALCLVFTASDFTIVAASDAYLRATMTERSSILGRKLFEIFPDDPSDPAADGVRNLRQSLEKVILTRNADVMPVQRYPVRRPEAEGGGFEERYWSPINSPVFGDDGQLSFIIHRVEDVTTFVKAKARAGKTEEGWQMLESRAQQMEAEIALRADDRRRTEELEKALDQLRQSEARFRQLADAMPQIVWMATPDGFPDYFNSRWYEFTGTRESGAEDLNWTPILHPDDLEPCMERWYRSVGTGQIYEMRYRFLERRSGTYRWFLGRACPVRDDNGRITRWFGTCTDIHDLVRAEIALRESSERFRFLAESMPQKIFTARANGEIDYLNRQWLEFTGLTFEQMSDWRWTQFVHPDDLEENLRRWQHSIETGELFEYEHRFRRADGEYRWHITRAHPMRTADGKVVMWIGSNTEIDEVKRAQADAERANRAKDNFLAALSHELRTPLTPVLLCAAALERETALLPEYREQLGMMRRNVELEARLIDDLLDLTRISRGKLDLNVGPADVHSLLAHTEQIVRSDARKKGVELLFALKAGKHNVAGDAGRLHQVFWNVLKNAIKFTPGGGRITVRTSNPSAGRIRIEVRDTGVGIDPSMLATIFGAFVQGENESHQKTDGLGLGMSISKTIVELHGGTIRAHSRGIGKGATFTVDLHAIESVAEGDVATPAMQSPAAHFYRILLVEDHQPTIEVLARLLRKQGHEVMTASTVEAALEFAAGHEFDLVISDLGLPDGNGVDMMKQLTRDYGLRGVALSGYGMDGDLATTKNAGFIAHLIKPIDFERLNRVLEEAATAA